MLQIAAARTDGGNDGSGIPPDVFLPTEARENDLAVFCQIKRNSNLGVGSSGATLIQAPSNNGDTGITGHLLVAYKVLTAADVAAGYLRMDGSVFNWSSSCVLLRGADGYIVDPATFAHGPAVSNTGSGLTISGSSLTGTAQHVRDGLLIVFVGTNTGNNNNHSTYTSTMTELSESSTGGRCSTAAYRDADAIVIGANAFPTITQTLSNQWSRYGLFVAGRSIMESGKVPIGDGLGYGS